MVVKLDPVAGVFPLGAAIPIRYTLRDDRDEWIAVMSFSGEPNQVRGVVLNGDGAELPVVQPPSEGDGRGGL